MATPTVYVLCDQNCKYEGMTKEQILAAITQAVNEGTIGDIDTGFVTTIKTINGTPLKFFVGSQVEYNALTEEQREGLFAIITDDATKEALFNALELLQDDVKSLQKNMNSMLTGDGIVKAAKVAQSIKPIDITESEGAGVYKVFKPIRTGLYEITIAGHNATALLSIKDLTKTAVTSIDVLVSGNPTTYKKYIVKYADGKIYLDISSGELAHSDEIESCYLLVPYTEENSSTLEPTTYYTITTNLVNCYANNTEKNIEAGNSYSNSISVNDGCGYLSITVTMGGVDVTGDCVNCNDNWGLIGILDVTGDIVITATAINNDNTGGDDNTGEDETDTKYSVTNNLTNCVNSNTANSVNEGSPYSATITADDGYKISGFGVTMGGVAQSDAISGNLHNMVIDIPNVTGDIVIAVTATATETEDIEVVVLPDEYQQVAYIETNGNQYIETHIIPELANGEIISVEFIGKRNDALLEREYLYGCTDTVDNEENRIGNVRFDYIDGKTYLEVGKTESAATFNAIPNVGEKFNIYTESRVDMIPFSILKINDEMYESDTSNTDAGVQSWTGIPLYLLWCNGAGENEKYCGKLYGCRIGINNTDFQYDFVPCYRKSDGVVGLYEKNHEYFYTNSGTGEFTMGAEIH